MYNTICQTLLKYFLKCHTFPRYTIYLYASRTRVCLLTRTWIQIGSRRALDGLKYYIKRTTKTHEDVSPLTTSNYSDISYNIVNIDKSSISLFSILYTQFRQAALKIPEVKGSKIDIMLYSNYRNKICCIFEKSNLG